VTDEELVEFAKYNYNRAWELVMEGSDEDALAGLECAAASLDAWRKVGTPKNEAIGLWMLSRALLKTGSVDEAIAAAEKCVSIARSLEIDWMIASALEALTRATRGTEAFSHNFAAAAAAIDAIADQEERELIAGQFADLR
jgi:hypothetical protein